MATQLFTNNATGYLNASIASGATSIVIQSGQGALFPSPSGGDWFLVTLFDGTSTIEICKCTARTTDTLTVVRAQEGTTAAAFAAGARCELRATKGTFEGLVQRDAVETITNKTFVDCVGAGAYTSKTIATNTTLNADSEYETGKNLRVNRGVTLAIPATSRLNVRNYATGLSL